MASLRNRVQHFEERIEYIASHLARRGLRERATSSESVQRSLFGHSTSTASSSSFFQSFRDPLRRPRSIVEPLHDPIIDADEQDHDDIDERPGIIIQDRDTKRQRYELNDDGIQVHQLAIDRLYAHATAASKYGRKPYFNAFSPASQLPLPVPLLERIILYVVQFSRPATDTSDADNDGQTHDNISFNSMFGISRNWRELMLDMLYRGALGLDDRVYNRLMYMIAMHSVNALFYRYPQPRFSYEIISQFSSLFTTLRALPRDPEFAFFLVVRYIERCLTLTQNDTRDVNHSIVTSIFACTARSYGTKYSGDGGASDKPTAPAIELLGDQPMLVISVMMHFIRHRNIDAAHFLAQFVEEKRPHQNLFARMFVMLLVAADLPLLIPNTVNEQQDQMALYRVLYRHPKTAYITAIQEGNLRFVRFFHGILTTLHTKATHTELFAYRTVCDVPFTHKLVTPVDDPSIATAPYHPIALAPPVFVEFTPSRWFMTMVSMWETSDANAICNVMSSIVGRRLLISFDEAIYHLKHHFLLETLVLHVPLLLTQLAFNRNTELSFVPIKPQSLRDVHTILNFNQAAIPDELIACMASYLYHLTKLIQPYVIRMYNMNVSPGTISNACHAIIQETAIKYFDQHMVHNG